MYIILCLRHYADTIYKKKITGGQYQGTKDIIKVYEEALVSFQRQCHIHTAH